MYTYGHNSMAQAPDTEKLKALALYIDRNGDGTISLAEFLEAFQVQHPSSF